MTPLILIKMLSFLLKKKEDDKIEINTVKDIYLKLTEIEGRLSLVEAKVKKISDYIKGEKLNEWREEAEVENKELEAELMSAIGEYQSGVKLQDIIIKHPSLLKMFNKLMRK